MKQTVLTVEDDYSIREMIKFALESEGYECFLAEGLDEAEANLSQEDIQVILLDWMLPGLSGVELAKRIRKNKKGSAIPIIMITAKAEEADKLKGFSAGVDDYITKPFSVNELLARISAILRRASSKNDVIEKIPLKIDNERKEILVDGEKVKVTQTEFLLLSFLNSRRDRVFTRNELLDHVWGNQNDIEERTVDVHIRRLRKALKPFNADVYVKTVRGFGYCFSTNSS